VLLYVCIIVAAAACAYANGMETVFAFDDHLALENNLDTKETTPWTRMWKRDFWGQNIQSTSSHKSYRPLCVALFRVQRMLAKAWYPAARRDVQDADLPIDTRPFRVTSLLLHAFVSLLVYACAVAVFRQQKCARGAACRHSRARAPAAREGALVAAVLFAVHPVHTESVNGAVGQADLLSGVFFCASYLVWTYSVRADGDNDDNDDDGDDDECGGDEITPTTRESVCERLGLHRFLVISVAVAILYTGVLCKEVVITAPGLMGIHDLLHYRTRQLRWWRPAAAVAAAVTVTAAGVAVADKSASAADEATATQKANTTADDATETKEANDKVSRVARVRHVFSTLSPAFVRILLWAAVIAGYVLFRRVLSGAGTSVGHEVFRHIENPIAFAPSTLARHLTRSYNHFLYARLLAWPRLLSVDWSKDCVPVLTHWQDKRVAAAALLYAGLFAVIAVAFAYYWNRTAVYHSTTTTTTTSTTAKLTTTATTITTAGAAPVPVAQHKLDAGAFIGVCTVCDAGTLLATLAWTVLPFLPGEFFYLPFSSRHLTSCYLFSSFVLL
jgi:hypothetical protein